MSRSRTPWHYQLWSIVTKWGQEVCGYLVGLSSSWASWWAKLWLSGVYCGALGVEFLSAGETYGGELLVCDSGYYSKWVLAVYLRVVGVFFWWCGGCHSVSHGVGNHLVFFVLRPVCYPRDWSTCWVCELVFSSSLAKCVLEWGVETAIPVCGKVQSNWLTLSRQANFVSL